MSDAWMMATAANTVLFIGYAYLAVGIGIGLSKGRQWRANPVGEAAFAIFATCDIGHGVHAEHTVLPASFGAAAGDPASLEAARTAASMPLVWVWHSLTVLVVVAYLLQRQRLRLLSRAAALCEDMVDRQRRAARLQEDVHGCLTDATGRLDADDLDGAMAAIDRALGEARAVATELVVGDAPVRAGKMRALRSAP